MDSANPVATRELEPPNAASRRRFNVRFDRNELSGAFGDMGTDFPLIASMVIAANLDTTGVLVLFGLLQIMSGLVYGMPMPVQPLKAMAVIVITQKLSGELLFGGGLAIGVIMLLLTVTGLIDRLAWVVPKSVVRGIQFGLGLQLATISLRDHLPSLGVPGYMLGFGAFVLTVLLAGNRRLPPAPFVLGLGLVYALLFHVDVAGLARGAGFFLPAWRVPQWGDVWTGFLILAIPQIPLSLGNSILATRQIVEDYFPERRVSVRRISLTYSLMNLVNPFFGGVPTCHGSGGLAGHYAFGARTGGSTIIYGLFYLTLGLFFSAGFSQIIHLFPKPVLAVILLFEALVLMALVRDMVGSRSDFFIVLLVGLSAATLPYGYVTGLVLGTVLAWWWRRRSPSASAALSRG